MPMAARSAVIRSRISSGRKQRKEEEEQEGREYSPSSGRVVRSNESANATGSSSSSTRGHEAAAGAAGSDSPRNTAMDSYSRPPDKNSRTYKVLVVGDAGTGKTAFVNRYVQDVFSTGSAPTVGMDFQLKQVLYPDDLTVNVQMWDVAGQDRHAHLTRPLFRGAHGVVVLFDMTSRSTWDSVLRWKQEIDATCRLPNGRKFPVVLAATKVDLMRRGDGIPDNMSVTQFAIDHGFIQRWFRTSAKTGDFVWDAMSMLLQFIIAHDTWSAASIPIAESLSIASSGSNSGSNVVSNNQPPPNQNSNFCGC